MRVFILLALAGAVAAQSGFFQIPGVRTRPQGFRRPQQQRRPQFTRQRPQQQFRPQQQQFSSGGFQQNQISRGSVDDRNGNSEYHYSWRHGGGDMTGDQARRYCTNLGGGWRGVSIESANENSYISRVIGGERLQYIWTGGVKSGRGFNWERAGGVGYTDWSHTGGARRPQPDNREGNENCIAILNNFYRDNIKWHDVACSHRKPIICERP